MDKKLAEQHFDEDQKLKLIEWNYCAYCAFKAKKSTELIEHILKEHSNSKYQCGHCYYRSCEIFNLQCHINAHHSNRTKKTVIVCSLPDEKWKFKCIFCLFKTDEKNDMREHMRNFHSNKQLICETNNSNYDRIVVNIRKSCTDEKIQFIDEKHLNGISYPLINETKLNAFLSSRKRFKR